MNSSADNEEDREGNKPTSALSFWLLLKVLFAKGDGGLNKDGMVTLPFTATLKLFARPLQQALRAQNFAEVVHGWNH